MTVDVGAVGAFPEGQLELVDCGNQQIGIVRWRGSVYALRNVCPHQGGPACGALSRHLGSPRPGEVEVDDGLVVRCAWHGWEFAVDTGRAVWSDRYRLKTWRARIEGDRVLVDLPAPASGARPSGRPGLPGAQP